MFEKLNLKFKKKKFDKENDVSRIRTEEFNLPLVNAKDGENGIMYYGRSEDFDSAEMTIDIVNDGAISTGNVYSQPQKTGVLYNAYLLKSNFEISEKLLHFFTSSIQKSIKTKFGYENKAGWAKVREEKIQLPTKKKEYPQSLVDLLESNPQFSSKIDPLKGVMGETDLAPSKGLSAEQTGVLSISEIDFEFMESFIAELELERIAELEAYLKVSGLDDYELNVKEQKILEEFENGKFEWGEFRIEDVLDWQSQKEINPLKLDELKDEKEKIYPFYGQSTTNNGVISYNQLIKKVLNNKEAKPTILIHSNNQNTVYLETPFYLKDGHGATSVLQSEFLDKMNAQFFISSIKKVILTKYAYNNKATKIKLKNTLIQLPTKNGEPDYDQMQTLISAIQKLVIKDVVEYAGRKVVAARQIVN